MTFAHFLLPVHFVILAHRTGSHVQDVVDLGDDFMRNRQAALKVMVLEVMATLVNQAEHTFPCQRNHSITVHIKYEPIFLPDLKTFPLGEDMQQCLP